jgi:DNA polymerase-3 subunit delta'
MPFAEIVGQDRAIASLRAALRRDALHHAYLFGGPEGVGKGTAARLLAQAANCTGPGTADGALADDPCGACGPCRKIAKGVHPDVLFLAEERVMAKAGTWEPRGGKSPSKDIVVDQVRDVALRRLALRRFEGRRRFVVVDPADAMNPQAQNALLKTLEEPPPGTTLVLVASNPDALLPTIRSRCLRVTFAPVPAGLVAERLEAAGRSPEAARFAAALSGGSLGRALRLPEGEGLVEERAAILDAAGLHGDDAGGWLSYAARHGKDRERAAATCDLLALWLRDVLAARAGAALLLTDVGEATRGAAARTTPGEVARRAAAVRKAAEALVQNASPVLALEAMLVRWFHGRA